MSNCDKLSSVEEEPCGLQITRRLKKIKRMLKKAYTFMRRKSRQKFNFYLDMQFIHQESLCPSDWNPQEVSHDFDQFFQCHRLKRPKVDMACLMPCFSDRSEFKAQVLADELLSSRCSMSDSGVFSVSDSSLEDEVVLESDDSATLNSCRSSNLYSSNVFERQELYRARQELQAAFPSFLSSITIIFSENLLPLLTSLSSGDIGFLFFHTWIILCSSNLSCGVLKCIQRLLNHLHFILNPLFSPCEFNLSDTMGLEEIRIEFANLWCKFLLEND